MACFWCAGSDIVAAVQRSAEGAGSVVRRVVSTHRKGPAANINDRISSLNNTGMLTKPRMYFLCV